MNLYHLTRIPNESDDPSCFYWYGSIVPNMTIGVYDSEDKAKEVVQKYLDERARLYLWQVTLDWQNRGDALEAVVTHRFKGRNDYKAPMFTITAMQLNSTITKHFLVD